MSLLSGFIGVPVSKVRRALEFAEQYTKTYNDQLEAAYNSAVESYAAKRVGFRELKRAFYMVPVSEKEALEEAKHAFRYRSGAYAKCNLSGVAKETGISYSSLSKMFEGIEVFEKLIPDLRVIVEAGSQENNILLDLDSCKYLNLVINLANKEKFE